MDQHKSRRPGVPYPVSSFVGREREIRAIGDLLSRYRVVTLVGAGGCGKTRLAVEAVRRHGDRFPGGVWMVDLTTLPAGESVGPRVAEAVAALGQRSDRWDMDALTELVGNRKTLLVLDNCEHLVESCAAVTSHLLSTTPALRVIATSREPLRVAGEAVYQVPPLGPDDSFRLFVERAKARAPGLLAAGETREVIAQICATLDGLPLAIELASARVGFLTPAQLLPLLQDRFSLLTGGARDTPARHRTLRAAVDWTYGLLDIPEQKLFKRLCVFVGGFDLEAASAFGGDGVLAVLGNLVDKSVVAPTTTMEPDPRYHLLETLREYGLARLEDDGEVRTMRTAHLWHYVERAERTFQEGLVSGPHHQLVALEPELENLSAALTWSLEEAPQAGLRLVGAARDLWFLRAQRDGLRFAKDLLAVCPQPDSFRARALSTAGQLANTLQRHGEAIAYLEEAREISQETGELRQEAWATWFLGLAGFLSRDTAAAERWLGLSLELFERCCDRVGIGRATANLGTVLFLRGDLESARTTLMEARAIAEGVDDQWGQGLCRTYLGLAAMRAGDHREGDVQLRAAVDLLAPIRDITMLTFAFAGIALNRPAADRRRAIRLASAATAIRRWIGGDFAPMMGEAIEELRAQARGELGREIADAQWEAGQCLGIEAVLSMALEQRPREAPRRQPSVLSAREIEISRLVAEGLSNQAIAERLHLSPRTVENHVFHVLNKLGLDNRTQIATWLLRTTVD